MTPWEEVGRGTAKKGTVRIYKSGAMRLSPDLVTAKKFHLYTIPATKLRSVGIGLVACYKGDMSGSPHKIWYSNPYAKSPLIVIVGALHALGLSPKKVMGEYKATVFAERIVVYLEDKIKKAV